MTLIRVFSDLDAISHEAASLFIKLAKESVKAKTRFVALFREAQLQEDFTLFWVLCPIGIRLIGPGYIFSGWMSGVSQKTMKRVTSRSSLIGYSQKFLSREPTFTESRAKNCQNMGPETTKLTSRNSSASKTFRSLTWCSSGWEKMATRLHFSPAQSGSTIQKGL